MLLRKKLIKNPLKKGIMYVILNCKNVERGAKMSAKKRKKRLTNRQRAELEKKAEKSKSTKQLMIILACVFAVVGFSLIAVAVALGS